MLLYLSPHGNKLNNDGKSVFLKKRQKSLLLYNKNDMISENLLKKRFFLKKNYIFTKSKANNNILLGYLLKQKCKQI